jgi:hypothetical protein
MSEGMPMEEIEAQIEILRARVKKNYTRILITEEMSLY